jgi:hypothetical protein
MPSMATQPYDAKNDLRRCTIAKHCKEWALRKCILRNQVCSRRWWARDINGHGNGHRDGHGHRRGTCSIFAALAESHLTAVDHHTDPVNVCIYIYIYICIHKVLLFLKTRLKAREDTYIPLAFHKHFDILAARCRSVDNLVQVLNQGVHKAT